MVNRVDEVDPNKIIFQTSFSYPDALLGEVATDATGLTPHPNCVPKAPTAPLATNHSTPKREEPPNRGFGGSDVLRHHMARGNTISFEPQRHYCRTVKLDTCKQDRVEAEVRVLPSMVIPHLS